MFSKRDTKTSNNVQKYVFIGQYVLREKCPNTEFFLVRISPHLVLIRRDTPYISVFSQNAGKYETEKTQYLDTFHAVIQLLKLYRSCFVVMYDLWMLLYHKPMYGLQPQQNYFMFPRIKFKFYTA